MSETEVVTERLPYVDARYIVDELVGLLRPSWEQIQVCGSIRRRAPTVGDIDLVVVPKLATVATMFGDIDGHISLLNHQLDELCGQQVIHQARRADGAIASWGPRLRKFTFKGVRVQCQATEADSFGMWVLIRTGPASYVHAFVTPRGSRAATKAKRGDITAWRAGMLPPGFTIERHPDKGGFRLHRAHLFVPTPTERSVYDALGQPYLEPWERR